jgi:glucose-1-phosphate adenylyltransferase
MTDLHGIIYAFHSFPELGALQMPRTAASLPFCGRYRLIDFSLSALANFGVRDVGVIVQRDYNSLLDHLRGGKEWDLSRWDGGLHILPPFGLPSSHLGEYKGCMEALSAVRSYLSDIRQKYVFLTRGDLVANIDLAAALESHVRSGAAITAVCTESVPRTTHHRYILGEDGRVTDLLCTQRSNTGGVTALEVYIANKDALLELVDYCSAHRQLHFHRDALRHYLAKGGQMNAYLHTGYSRHITTVDDYFQGSMDMFDLDKCDEVFSAERPVRTREHADASTYYGEQAVVRNCLIADGCQINGILENCIVFRGSTVEEGAQLTGCIIMQNGAVGAGARLNNIIADKDVIITENTVLAGSPGLPMIIPKGMKI